MANVAMVAVTFNDRTTGQPTMAVVVQPNLSDECMSRCMDRVRQLLEDPSQGTALAMA